MSSQHPGRGGHCPREPTQEIRIPLNRVADVRALIRPDTEQSAALFGTVGDYTLLTPTEYPTPRACTLYHSRVAAGFPSPADDYIEGQLDLNRYLVDRPAATFFVRVEGDSMLGAGIHPGDLLVVDRSRQAGEGSVIIAVLDGELTVKRLRYRGEQAWLYPENEAYPPLAITDAHDFQIWGVVRHVVHSF